MLIVIAAIILLIIIGSIYSRKKTLSDLLVVTYETDLKNKHLSYLKASLEKNGYKYTILTDKKWTRFGGKIKKISKYLKGLNPNQLVIVMDARDVLSVNFDSASFIAEVSDISQDKVIVSTEIGCCVPARYKPGELRTTTGKIINRTYDKTTSGENFDEMWKKMFKTRATHKKIKHPVEHKQSIYLNAGIYCGKAKTILEIYNLMNISSGEDDQLIMSEVFYHFPNKFHLDYNRVFFSNSHVWDSNNNKDVAEDTGCYYVRENDRIKDVYLSSFPYFIHTPGKHFRCYDHVLKSI